MFHRNEKSIRYIYNISQEFFLERLRKYVEQSIQFNSILNKFIHRLKLVYRQQPAQEQTW